MDRPLHTQPDAENEEDDELEARNDAIRHQQFIEIAARQQAWATHYDGILGVEAMQPDDIDQLKGQIANHMQLFSDLFAVKTRMQKEHTALLERYKSLEARHNKEVSEARHCKLDELLDAQRMLAEETAKSQRLEMQIMAMEAQQAASVQLRDAMHESLKAQRDLSALHLNKTKELEATVHRLEYNAATGDGPAKRARQGE